MDDILDAIILAGGKGSRLKGIVSDRPKPMAIVAGRPFLEWLIVALRIQGVKRFVLSIGHMGECVLAHFGDGRKWKVDITYSWESTPLGTGGAVRSALSYLQSERFLVLNGDSYCRFDLSRLTELHLRWQAQATIGVVQVDDCRRYGTVSIDDMHTVRAFQEKPLARLAGLINAGLYVLENTVVQSIPTEKAISLEREFLPTLIGRGLYAAVGDGPFIDIGIPETYARAGEFVNKEKLAWPNAAL